MPVYGVPRQAKGLTGVPELGLLKQDPRPRARLRGADHDSGAKLPLLRGRVPLEDNISGQDGHLAWGEETKWCGRQIGTALLNT